MKNSVLQLLGFRIVAFLAVLAALVAVGGVLILHFSPAAGAYGADELRKIIGDKPVAMMETALFEVQDQVMGVAYRLGLAQPVQSFSSPGNIPVTGGAPTGSPAQVTPAASAKLTNLAPAPATQNNLSPSGAPSGVVTAPQISQGWTLPVIADQSGLPANVEWQPYLVDASGRVVAYRALVHADPNRPYAYVAIVAFDLRATRLHYVIGKSEPYAPGVNKIASGAIPPADFQSGLLVAAFNGGFKYEHGHSGSMADGFVSAPPKDGYGTLAIYPNGEIKIGEWGKDFTSSTNLAAFRQNGPLLIQDGKINQLVDDPKLWGYTISGGTVTFRSGIAISPDGRTLYYFAGQYLSAPVLANAMAMVHPQAGMQLDINDYWVYFSAFQQQGNTTTVSPLLPKVMAGTTQRFMRPYDRDFFYVTITK